MEVIVTILRIGFALILLLLMVVIFRTTFVHVPNGALGFVYRGGALTQRRLVEGWHVLAVVPLLDSVVIVKPTRVEPTQFGVILRNGVPQRVVTAGEYHLIPIHEQIQIFDLIRIPPGSVGVVYNLDGTETDRLLPPGEYALSPYQFRVIIVPISEKTYVVVKEERASQVQADFLDHPVETVTADGRPVKIFYTIHFSIPPNEARRLVNVFGEDVLSGVVKFVKDEGRQIVEQTLNKFGFRAEQLFGMSLDNIERAMREALQARFTAKGLSLAYFGLRHIDLGEYAEQKEKEVLARQREQTEIAETEVRKQQLRREEMERESAARSKHAEAIASAEAEERISRSQLEKAQIELKLTETRLQQELIEAEAAAKKRKLEVETEAELKRLMSEAEAHGYRVLAEAITPSVIRWQQMQIELATAQRWDGRLPTFPSGVIPFVASLVEFLGGRHSDKSGVSSVDVFENK
ncbi:MAG: SPFH domain-containing protein [Anaerolineales bacterium]|nr:SPFH domain-containing protein [Anaerolineales bacterium]MDW8447585.1 SPFH domain-containing protein [Anaerolineales bacterium]